MSEAVVTQADRISAMECHPGSVGNEIANGEADDHYLVQAFARRAQAEREAVVAWLREQAAGGRPFDLDGMESLGLPLDIAAAAIERGQHIKENTHHD